MHKLIRLFFLLCGLSLITPTVTASLIHSDLTITANTLFDINSLSAGGSATQNAELSRFIGGVSTLSTVTNTIVSGDNPLGGVLTDIGDGVGANAAVDYGLAGSGIIPGFFFDINFSLVNSSATDSYQILFALVFSNLVDVDGSDAYLDGEINLFNSLNNEIFATDLTSDTLGDQVAGIPTGTSAQVQSESGAFLFSVTLGAGATDNFNAQLKMDGQAFDTVSRLSGNTGFFISVEDVNNLTGPPTQVPGPQSFILLISAIALLQFKQKLRY